MNIEIITTKKKISKSIIRQLEPASINDINHFNSMPTIGYYVRDLGAKFPPKVALFEGINGWKIIGLRDWKPAGSNRIECNARDMGVRGTSVKTIGEQIDRDDYLDAYNEMKKSCLKNHLII